MNSRSIRHLVLWTTTAAMIAAAPRPTWSASFSAFTRTDYAIGSQLSVAIADFNHDGKPDLAGVLVASSVNVFLGNGDGTFAPVTTFSIGQSGAQTVISADVTGDGNADLLVTSQSSSNLSVLLGNGDGTFAAPLVSAGSGKYVKTADFNNDGRLDVVVNGPGLLVRLGHGDGTFDPGISVPASGCTVTELMVGDFNEDGMQDIAALNPCPFGAVSLLLGNGDGTFGTETRIPIPHTDFGDVGDLNGDGHTDIVSSGGGGFSILLGNGDGTFSITNLSVGWELRNVKIADLNQDGFPDLAVAEHTLDVLFLVAGHGDGTFEAEHGLSSGHRPLTVGVGDFNGDGLLDVLTPVIDVSGFTGGISVFLDSNAPAGSAPVLTAPSVVTVTEGSTVSFGVSASDPDGDPIDQLLDAVSIAGRIFTTSADNTSGTYSWTPGIRSARPEPYSVVFTARNALASFATTHIQVDTLLSANVPVLAQPSDMTVTEGFTQDQALTATDADGNPLTFSKVSGPTFMTVQTTNRGTGSATGSIHLAPGPSDSGAYSATVRASDGALYDEKSFAITVIDSPGAPILAPIANMTTHAGGTADQGISATDPDADAITFTYIGPPWMTLTSNPQVGTTRTGNIHLAPNDFGQFGATVTATANGQSDSRTFSIYVSQFGGFPIITAPASVNGTENTAISVTGSATDPDAGQLVTLSQTHTGAFLTGPASAGPLANPSITLSGTPSLTQSGTYTVNWTATDGTIFGTASATTSIVITNVNRNPVITAPATVQGGTGRTVFVTGSSVDPDGQNATLSQVNNAPFFAASSSAGPSLNPSITLTGTPSFTAAGTYTVNWTAVDTNTPTAGSASAITSVVIANPNPVITAPATVNGSTETSVSVTGLAMDPDGQNVTLSQANDAAFLTGPASDGPSLNPSITLTGTPSATQAGTYSINWSAIDSNFPTAGSATATTSLFVIQCTRAFTTASKGTIRLASGKPFWCVAIEPQPACYTVTDINPTSIVLISLGTGSVSQISAATAKGLAVGDTDRNDVEDITVCFRKEDLRLLFSNVTGKATVDVTVAGQLSGGGTFSATLSVEVIGSGGGQAASVYPNPLNPDGILSFVSTTPGQASVQLFDHKGRLVRTLKEETLPAGYHDVRIDGRDGFGRPLASGIYFYRVKLREGTLTGRFSVLK